jgi:hypothetical protein
MTSLAAACLIAALWCDPASAPAAQAKALQLNDQPASVQKTVEVTLKGGAIGKIAREKEDGIEHYEIESTPDGKSRDFNVAADGRLLVVEAATTLDAIPAAARIAIQKTVGRGTVTTAETFAKPGEPLLYEAA